MKEKVAEEEEVVVCEKTAGELFGEAANFHKPGKDWASTFSLGSKFPRNIGG